MFESVNDVDDIIDYDYIDDMDYIFVEESDDGNHNKNKNKNENKNDIDMMCDLLANENVLISKDYRMYPMDENFNDNENKNDDGIDMLVHMIANKQTLKNNIKYYSPRIVHNPHIYDDHPVINHHRKRLIFRRLKQKNNIFQKKTSVSNLYISDTFEFESPDELSNELSNESTQEIPEDYFESPSEFYLENDKENAKNDDEDKDEDNNDEDEDNNDEEINMMVNLIANPIVLKYGY